jgi:hypothetical protein
MTHEVELVFALGGFLLIAKPSTQREHTTDGIPTSFLRPRAA